jgi:nucleotide-binding universal stress UspA family protein
MFRSILIAYDDSPGARRALDLALGIAAAGDSTELTATAIEAPPPRFGGTTDEYQEEHAFEERLCARWLDAATAIASARGVELRTEHRTGHPAKELVRAAEDAGADLIVLGHSGHSGAWGRFLGTTAERVSRHVHCSVLIAAPPEGRDSTPA